MFSTTCDTTQGSQLPACLQLTTFTHLHLSGLDSVISGCAGSELENFLPIPSIILHA